MIGAAALIALAVALIVRHNGTTREPALHIRHILRINGK